jgi:hypothetical protein
MTCIDLLQEMLEVNLQYMFSCSICFLRPAKSLPKNSSHSALLEPSGNGSSISARSIGVCGKCHLLMATILLGLRYQSRIEYFYTQFPGLHNISLLRLTQTSS